MVVGAGLAGLTAALHLSRAGRRTLVLERLPLAGGLCGAWTSDGHRFPRACHDFGQGLVREMRDLGVAVRFAPSRWRLHLGGRHLALPPDGRTVSRIARDAPAILRLLRAGRRGGHSYLGELLDAAGPPPRLSDMECALAYLAALPPARVRLSDMSANLSGPERYGYHRPMTPVGGPQALTDAMVARLATLGGELRLSSPVVEVTRDGDGFAVTTPDGTVRCRQVVSSAPRWDAYPAASRGGLHIGQLLLAVGGGLRLPPGVDGVYHVPPGVAAWMDALDRGEPPGDFGFHLVQSVTDPTAWSIPEGLAVYFLLPRGELDPTAARRGALTEHILDRAEALLPSLRPAIVHQRLLSPADFARVHGLSSSPLQRLLPAGAIKPEAHDPATGIEHVGNSVAPQGEHAGGAVASGRLAAQRVLRRLS